MVTGLFVCLHLSINYTYTAMRRCSLRSTSRSAAFSTSLPNSAVMVESRRIIYSWLLGSSDGVDM